MAGELTANAAGRLRYLRQSHCGLNAARDHPMRQAHGSLVAFIDNDEIAPPSYLELVTTLFDELSDAGGVGGPCLAYGGPRQRTCARRSLASANVSREGRRPTECLLGVTTVLRRALFDTDGAFEEELSGRGAESEWFYRARGLGFIQDPDLRVWHRRDERSLRRPLHASYRQGAALPLATRCMEMPYTPRATRIGRYWPTPCRGAAPAAY